ncbi:MULTISPECIES: methyltransferase domain-containing protein [Nostocales]|uniref:Class I SAM-dependent methyltransferase n=1 Tax=Dolichospermum flos-aquae UHCC 0037 TaxID=2590026 RepID=A0ACC7S943_DOLFA|nr:MULTISPECIES: methyltransferase domain-containing protein [Nostocales]MBO1065492.1 class I SAM-dependent methyltransferase [Anabaena sp. 54]MTJ45043.1 class I SAM-dependent methyltransferase [Dolichospermum flos-aquae UHCC 0037]
MKIIKLFEKLISQKAVFLDKYTKDISGSAEVSSINYNDCLVQSNGDIFGSSVFLVKNGYRHYIPDLDWVIQHGFTWPTDINNVTDEVLINLLPGRPAPRKWSLEEWINPPRDINMMKMREIATSRLTGYGIECGAGASPLPLPLNCHVKYVDRFSKSELQHQLYPGQQFYNFIEPDILSDLNNLDGIEDNSLDFIVACHVIEHLRNPIGALEKAYKKLRMGGSIVLVIPDKERTFDKKRKLTVLEHLILDYQEPSKNRDKEHYIEFFELAFQVSSEKLYSTIEENFQAQADIHYHTFTYESFSVLINYVHNHICSWSSVWSQPTLSNSLEDIEFYFILTK